MHIQESLLTKNDQIGIVRGESQSQINIKGGEKVEAAVKSLSSFGLVTFSRDYYFKSSQYSIHFFKPIAKLKQLYNLGDEVLILCCNDSLINFKSRTKDLLDKLLGPQSEYRNRLDKVTCIVIDDCEDIEEVIKQDRIDNPDARLIIPFAYIELQKGISTEDLQNRLRSFLYERDLFGLASPLQSDNLFFGKDRSNIISELYGKYQQGEHGGLFGLRRIGKTSTLNLLRRKVEQDGGIAIYFDCTKYHHLKWNSFLHQITKEIQEKYSYGVEETTIGFLPKDFLLNPSSSRYNESIAPISFEQDLKELHKNLKARRILLIFDEIEQIGFGTSPTKGWNEENDALFFWQTLRAVSQTDNRIFSFVITGVNPKCIEDSKINNQPNPIFNVLAPIYITLFDYSDVKKMVSEIGGHLGLQFDEEIYTKLIEDYGGHPFLIRQVCSKINAEVLERKETRPYTVSKYSYEKQSAEYTANMEAVIEQILIVLEDYYPKEYDLLKTLALNGSDTFKRSIPFGDKSITHLLGYCLIKKDCNDYYIRIKTISQYIVNKYKYEQQIDNVSEKRAQVAIRRNIIEEKLRTLVSIQLQSKYGRKAREQIIKLAKSTTNDSKQENRFINKDLKGVLQELYFIQLKEIMLKDWTNYQNIFTDKKKFDQYYDIMNSLRVDAHAKPLDKEDEAMLNYAFKYFETSLKEID